jgi:CheY-like chemotaxis protein
MFSSGSLKRIDLAKIMKEAQEASMTGVITLKGKAGLATITLKDGGIVSVREPRVRSRLGRYLVSRNIITEKELQAALTAQKQKGTTTPLGEILIELAVIDQDGLDEAIKNVMEDSIIHLFSWTEGLFRVDESDDIDGQPVNVATLDELAMRAEAIASAVEEDFAIEDIVPVDHVQEGVRKEITEAVKRVSSKLRELKPQEVVLLVEDEALLREMFRDKLTSFGFDVDAVDSPRAALELLAQYEKDGKLPIVLSDLIMPTLSGKGIFGGLELLEELQKTHSHIPVIVNTSYPDHSTRRRALFLGATYYINKPERKDVSPDKLESQLNLFIEEVALCIQNIIQRHEVYFERDQQNILREELLSQLIQSREELEKVGQVVQRDSGDIKFLTETSQKMVHDKSLGKMAETMVEFALREMDRGIIYLVRKDAVTGFYGRSRLEGDEGFNDAIRQVSFDLDEAPLFRKAVSDKVSIIRETPGAEIGLTMEQLMGERAPQHAVVMPMMVQNIVVAVLYCDVLPGGTPPRDIDSLEILLNLASLSLEIQQQHAVINRMKQGG